MPEVDLSQRERWWPLYRDELVWRFLHLFAGIFQSLEETIDRFPEKLDPLITDPEFLRYLASWIGLSLDENWPLHKRRRLVAEAMQLYRLRGTVEGVRRWLEIYTGFEPQVIEHHAAGMKIGVRSKIGVNTKIYNGLHRNAMQVTIRLGGTGYAIEPNRVIAIIREQLPPWVQWYLVAPPPDAFMVLELRSTIGVDTVLG